MNDEVERLIEDIYHLKLALRMSTHWAAHLHQIDAIAIEECEHCRETAETVYHAQDERTARFDLNQWMRDRLVNIRNPRPEHE